MSRLDIFIMLQNFDCLLLDIDECSSDNGGCSQTCDNIAGSHVCSCDSGYMLDTSDERSCLGNK